MKKWLLATTLFALLGFAPINTAEAVTEAQCINAHTNPQGSIATQCHQIGWTVNSYIGVTPAPGLVVRWVDIRYMRQCASENGGPNYPCWWNFWQPPYAGSKYWFDIGGHIHYVNSVNT